MNGIGSGMEIYKKFKKELLKINNDILSLFSKVKILKEQDAGTFSGWETTCAKINKQMSDDLIRVAVVGSIKSGKSTFVNSIFKGDFLKRGAGIVTSFVTKIRAGDMLKAELTFKSYGEINSEIRQALIMFPHLNLQAKAENFDIRNRQDRAELEPALNDLDTDMIFTDGIRNIHSILLSSYLKGYDRVKDIIADDITTACYDENFFPEHKIFVSDDTLSVYLKDIQLEINSSIFDKNIEIADCQGSDSPNPLHLAMIQDYLLVTHFIIYVISSRTGVRQADIKFLSMIKKMGIMENIIFVVNCDFNEHESRNDLNALIGSVQQDLSLLKTEPEVYSFSALFNLFKSASSGDENGSRLNKKDQIKFSQWKNETELCNFSEQETDAFRLSFNNKISKGRYRLLLKNHLERINIMSSGIGNWIAVNHEILNKDVHGARKIIKKIVRHQERMNRIMDMIKNTLDGAVQKMKQEQKKEVDKFFASRYGEAPESVVEFIREYNTSYGNYEDSFRSSGFSSTIYLVFQEFKQRLDTFIAEKINPEVIMLIRNREESIKKKFNSIAEPFEDMVQGALEEYNAVIAASGIPGALEIEQSYDFFDIDFIKRITGLTIPPVAATINYSAKIKTEAVIRFGFYTVVRFIKQIFKRPLENEKEEEIFALKDSLTRIKRETERAIFFHFKNYRENLKFQYLFKLIDAVSNSLYEDLQNRFSHNSASFSTMTKLIETKQIDKKQASEALKNMEEVYFEISKRIDIIKKEMKKIELAE